MFDTLLCFLLGFWFLAQAPQQAQPISLRALVSVGGRVVWASGTRATVLRTADNGMTWQTCQQPEGASTLDFRGIFAWSVEHAMVMSAGTGPLSRLYETTDACHSWHLLFTNPDPAGFWDSLAFSQTDPRKGVLLGDPVQGRFTIFRTADTGRHWIRDSSPALARNKAGEGAFAASNSSIVILPGVGDIVFGTGGPGGSRIFRFDAQRDTWSTAALPIATANKSSGIFSLHFRSATEGVAVGGDYKQPQIRTASAFLTRDGGHTWTSPASLPGGYRSAVAWDNSSGYWVAALSGLDVSTDNGETWRPLRNAIATNSKWNVLSLPWIAGSNGVPLRLHLPANP